MSKSVVLLYHDIYSDRVAQWITRSASLYHITERTFLEHMECLKTSGLVLKNITGLLEDPGQENSLALTFDDGWEGVYKFVLPLFKQLGWSATIFITKNFIDKPGFLTSAQLVELSDSGFEIGLHGTTHRLLSGCTEAEIRWEIGTCKEYLETLIGRPVDLMALPGGDESKLVIKCARDLGIRSISTSRPGINLPPKSLFLVKRIAIKANTTKADIARYCRFSLLREMSTWYVLEIPHFLLGGKKYTMLRKKFLNESKEDIYFKP